MEQLDGIGITGGMLQLGMAGAMIGSALLVFFYCWKRGILNFTEAPSKEMVDYEEFSTDNKDEHHG